MKLLLSREDVSPGMPDGEGHTPLVGGDTWIQGAVNRESRKENMMMV